VSNVYYCETVSEQRAARCIVAPGGPGQRRWEAHRRPAEKHKTKPFFVKGLSTGQAAQRAPQKAVFFLAELGFLVPCLGVAEGGLARAARSQRAGGSQFSNMCPGTPGVPGQQKKYPQNCHGPKTADVHPKRRSGGRWGSFESAAAGLRRKQAGLCA
jgi:hypothetical protein